MPISDYENMQPYNGAVDVGGEKVNVQNGIANFQGQQYFVSHDGKFVADQERNLIGTIRNGMFAPVDQQLLFDLQAIGGLDDQDDQQQQQY